MAAKEELKCRVAKLEEALEMVIEYHASGPWDAAKSKRWERWTGSPHASTRSLCDQLRSLRQSAESTESTSGESISKRAPTYEQLQHYLDAQRGKVQRAHVAFHELFPFLLHAPEEDFEPAAYLRMVRDHYEGRPQTGGALDLEPKAWPQADAVKLGIRVLEDILEWAGPEHVLRFDGGDELVSEACYRALTELKRTKP